MECDFVTCLIRDGSISNIRLSSPDRYLYKHIRLKSHTIHNNSFFYGLCYTRSHYHRHSISIRCTTNLFPKDSSTVNSVLDYSLFFGLYVSPNIQPDSILSESFKIFVFLSVTITSCHSLSHHTLYLSIRLQSSVFRNVRHLSWNLT